MANKKTSLIKNIRSGEKTPFLKIINPLCWFSILIGHSLKLFDKYIDFKKSIVQDIGNGKKLPWHIDLYATFHPLTLIRGYCLRAKNEVNNLIEKVIPAPSSKSTQNDRTGFISKIPVPKISLPFSKNSSKSEKTR